MWIIAEYEAASLFSLKLSSATTSGGKSLLIPTPYAIKMALLDVACRIWGVNIAQQRWPIIRDFKIAIRPSPTALVSNVFQRVLRARRGDSEESEDAGFFQRTIGYREYVSLHGSMSIALGWQADVIHEWAIDLMLNINYLGKRGGFIQLQTIPEVTHQIPNSFIELTERQSSFSINGTLQVLDDCEKSLTFAKANIYSDEKIKSDKDRVLRHIVIPYKLKRASKSFTWYETVETGR